MSLVSYCRTGRSIRRKDTRLEHVCLAALFTGGSTKKRVA